MSIETDKLNVPLWVILCVILCGAIIACGVWYYRLDVNDAKGLGLAGGILTGLIVYSLTFITLLSPLRELAKFRSMGVRALLANRHDQSYYRKLIGVSMRRVDVMGASCGRFVSDFLDADSDDKVLLDALTRHRHLKVRLLIPDDDHLSDEAKAALPRTLAKLEQARSIFGDRIILRRFVEKAHHSFVIVDNEVIAGPIFGDDRSKYGPAVHAAADTAFGRKYEEYFDTVWGA